MSKKFRLFASVATPLVALPLMMQTAGATPLKPVIAQTEMPGLIQVQQQVIVPDAESEGEAKPRPRRQQQGDAAQPATPRAAQSSETEQPAQRPRRQQQAEPEATPRQAQQPATEAPTPRAQRQPQAEPEATPRRAQQPAAEAPTPRAQRQPQADPAQGETQQPRRDRQRQQSGAETEAPAATETQPTTRGTGSQQRRSTESGATDPAASQSETPATRPRATDRTATPDAAPERPARRTTDAPATAPTGGAAQGTRQPGTAAQPDTATQPGTATQPSTATQPGTATQSGTAATPGTTATEAPATGTPATRNTTTANPATSGQQPAARTPATAGTSEQPVTPGENGAAVLDSAKQAPGATDAGRPRRQPPQQADQQQVAPPKSDAEAQGGTRATREQQTEFRQLREERGQRLDQRPEFERPRGWDFNGSAGRDRDRDGGRVIISIDNQPVVRHDDSRRFYSEGGRRPEYERLENDRVREVIIREDGTRVVTVRNRYGEIVQRTRVARGGEEYVLYSAPDLLNNTRGPDYVWRDPGADLPPMRLSVPVEDYIIDTSSEPDRDYYEFLEQPPVEKVERVYSLDEVRYSARIRDKVPRIDLDTITFATGSAEVPMNQASSLRKVADAITKVLERDPSETFLIEGHTDAVGADQENLVLSDERAESVARVLSDAFGIAPENLTTQGYGEQYLKVRTDGPEQQNRRVTIRRITSLVKPVASNQQ